MAVDARDDRADRRQIDVVVGMDIGHVGRAERVIAMRAGGERDLDDPVRMPGECAGHAGATGAGFLVAVRQGGLLVLRRRQAGVVWILRWGGEPSFQVRDACSQRGDLPGLRLHHGDNLPSLRIDQSDQVIARQGEEHCAVHALSWIDSAVTVSRRFHQTGGEQLR